MTTSYTCKNLIYKKLPLVVDPKKRYVFYIQDTLKASCEHDPQHCMVEEYNSILEALRDEGFHVISEKRALGTDMFQYAYKIAEDIRDLIRAWVPQEHITLVATSEGAAIGSIVSSLLKKDRVNYVLLHPDPLKKALRTNTDQLKLTGGVLSIYQLNTQYSNVSPQKPWDTSTTYKYAELSISSNADSRILYHPSKEWLEPTVNWAKRKY